MPTEGYEQNLPPLRNPQVDYERADLSAKGILWFLFGLLVAGVFIELVIWGMFNFLARSERLFAQGTVSPVFNAQKAKTEPQPGAIMQNTPPVTLSVFPQPRLQTDDAGEMQSYLASEKKLLNAPPFVEPSGAVHIPIDLAMKLIVERGLPTRPSAPPPEVNLQTGSGNPELLHEVPGPLAPNHGGEKSGSGGEQQP
jgi:hypothetical protein